MLQPYLDVPGRMFRIGGRSLPRQTIQVGESDSSIFPEQMEVSMANQKL